MVELNAGTLSVLKIKTGLFNSVSCTHNVHTRPGMLYFQVPVYCACSAA